MMKRPTRADNVVAMPSPDDDADNSIKEIRRMIASKQSSMVLDVLVTPAIAAELLRYNTPGVTNRRMSSGYVRQTAEMVRRGKWENTGEPIIMSDAGILNDGQHRLQMIVDTGIACKMDLRFGVARHAFANTNTGRRRSAYDVASIGGIPNALLCCSSARLILQYQIGLPSAYLASFSNQEVVDALEHWSGLPDAVQTLPSRTGLRNAPAGALAYFSTRSGTRAEVDAFWRVIRTGEGDADNPPHVLREFWTRNILTAGISINLLRPRALAVGIIAWNAFRAGEKIKQLRWSPEQPFPICRDLKL